MKMNQKKENKKHKNIKMQKQMVMEDLET